MPRFLTGWLHALAAMMRGMAAALERASGNARMSELAERFPDAPEHWLRHIAARAPELMEMSDAPRAIEPRMEHRAEELRLTEPKPSRPVRPKFHANAKPQAERKPFGQRERELKERPQLKFAPPSRSKSAELLLQDEPARAEQPAGANSNDRHTAKRNELDLDRVFRSGAKPDLHLVADGEKKERAQPEWTASASSNAAQPEFSPEKPSLLARLAQLIRLSRPAASAHGAATFDEREISPARSDYLWPEYRPHSEQTPLFMSPAFQPQRAAPVFQPHTPAKQAAPSFTRFSANAPKPAAFTDHANARWPALPPIVETVRDEHVERPRLSELRREQEEGLWNA